MARRKRKDDELPWKPPEFDEVGYMRQEIQNAKIATVVIAWAVVGAIIAYLLALWIPVVGYLAGLAVFGALYYVLPTLGLPIHGFKRRDWISHASVYFFSWLAFSIILLNPPFGDHTAPVVGPFDVGSFNSGGNLTTPIANTVSCQVVSGGGSAPIKVGTNQTVYVLFRATDNVQVASIHLEVGGVNASYSDVSGQASACASKPAHANLLSTYAVTFPVSTGSNVVVAVTAVDTAGLSTTATITVLPS